MAESDTILVNRVAESDLQTVALDQLVQKGSILPFDLQPFLFKGLIVKEKDFRESLKNIDWSEFKGKTLAVFCSSEAIIPMWAYMLVAIYATPFTSGIYFGRIEQVYESLLLHQISSRDWSDMEGKRVVIKGCSDDELPASAYLAIANKLQPLVQSLMYGEPCSTVPIFKRPRVV